MCAGADTQRRNVELLLCARPVRMGGGGVRRGKRRSFERRLVARPIDGIFKRTRKRGVDENRQYSKFYFCVKVGSMDTK